MADWSRPSRRPVPVYGAQPHQLGGEPDMKHPSRARGGLVAALAVASVALVPGAAEAKTVHAKKGGTHEAEQDFNIRRATRTNNHQRAQIADVTNSLGAAVEKLTGLDATIANLTPIVTKALTDLQAGLVAVGNGLTTVGNGLVSLKTLATSTEYGFGQVIVLVGATPTPQPGSFIVTPNIPDDVQQASNEQTFIAQHTGTLIVAYGVRSTESDGTGAANPAALCRVYVRNQGTGPSSFGQTAANGAIGGLPFQPVNTKSPTTSTVPANAGFPFGLKTSAPDADVTQNLSTAVAVTAGDPDTGGMSCGDTSPSADDPSA